MGLLKILTAIFILAFPIAEIGRIQFSNGIAVSINDILLLLVIFTWTSYHLFKKRKFTFGKLTKAISIFSFIGLLSLLLNFPNLGLNSTVISSLYLVRWVAYAFIYLIIFNFDDKFKKRLQYLLLFSGTLVVIGGYIQYFLYPSLRNLFYLGWDEHLYRMFSSFLDPNFAGAFFVIFFFYSITLWLKNFKKERNIKSITILSIAALTILAIYLTYSRSALLMLIFSMATYLFLLGKKKIIFFAILAVVLAIFVLPKSFQTEGTNFLRVASSEERIKSTNQAVGIFQSSPLYGVGFNAYRYAQNKRGLNNDYWQVTHSGAGTDNSFIFVLATTGIIGFTAYLWLLYKMIQIGRNSLKKNTVSVVLISSVVGLLVGSLFVNSLFYVLILEWIWILAALTEKS